VDDPTPAGDLESFLAARLVYRTDASGQEVCAVTAKDEHGKDVEVGVMMGWERQIMEETVRLLVHDARSPEGEQGLRILNVGFGLGIIDTLFQSQPFSPIKHTIIEPHSDVLAHMEARGWAVKPGVDIRRRKWQDVLGQDEEGEKWDVVYFDTFSEDYTDLKEFFALLPSILSGPNARFSFFNGLGATSRRAILRRLHSAGRNAPLSVRSRNGVARCLCRSRPERRMGGQQAVLPDGVVQAACVSVEEVGIGSDTDGRLRRRRTWRCDSEAQCLSRQIRD